MFSVSEVPSRNSTSKFVSMDLYKVYVAKFCVKLRSSQCFLEVCSYFVSIYGNWKCSRCKQCIIKTSYFHSSQNDCFNAKKFIFRVDFTKHCQSFGWKERSCRKCHAKQKAAWLLTLVFLFPAICISSTGSALTFLASLSLATVRLTISNLAIRL